MVAVANNKKALTDIDWAALYKRPRLLARHMQTLERSQNGDLLELAVIKGEGYGNYYSVIDKKPMKVPRKAQYFLLPWENKDYPDHYYIYSHHIAACGIVLRVKKQEIQILGLN
tara:strand:- start:381 stop:722 length:342 start_codon:yes stop_codon:yes gene_type:complete